MCTRSLADSALWACTFLALASACGPGDSSSSGNSENDASSSGATGNDGWGDHDPSEASEFCEPWCENLERCDVLLGTQKECEDVCIADMGFFAEEYGSVCIEAYTTFLACSAMNPCEEFGPDGMGLCTAESEAQDAVCDEQ